MFAAMLCGDRQRAVTPLQGPLRGVFTHSPFPSVGCLPWLHTNPSEAIVLPHSSLLSTSGEPTSVTSTAPMFLLLGVPGCGVLWGRHHIKEIGLTFPRATLEREAHPTPMAHPQTQAIYPSKSVGFSYSRADHRSYLDRSYLDNYIMLSMI